jgi:hypothetical protein
MHEAGPIAGYLVGLPPGETCLKAAAKNCVLFLWATAPMLREALAAVPGRTKPQASMTKHDAQAKRAWQGYEDAGGEITNG